LPVKQVWVYSWQPHARQQLCAVAPPSPPPPPVGDWATAEFGGAALGDRRLAPRLLVLARDFFARPQAQLPQACQSRAKTKAASRCFEHPATQMQTLLQPHYEQTRQRVQRECQRSCNNPQMWSSNSPHPLMEGGGR
jgi:hypothetical protein